jgi:hypothetical protein
MARQPFGGTGADMVYNPGTAPGDPVLSASGLPFHVYTDETAIHLADITTPGGDPISNSIITVDATTQLPSFLGPDTDPETYTLYVRAVAGGVVFKIFRNGGLPGVKGDSPTEADIEAAVSSYFITNPPPQGNPGPPGTVDEAQWRVTL